jgi:uncharacterized peroxidase-related enzyme
LIDQLVEDFESAELSPKLKAALQYARKLTETPSKMVPADAEGLYVVGWDEAALMNIVEITAVFAMYNRIADGTGVLAENTKTTLTKKKLGSYIENLINFGLKIPEDLKNVI